MSGHDQPEQAVTFKRNGRSRWAGICTNHKIWQVYEKVFPESAHGNLSPNPLLDDFLERVSSDFISLVEKIESEIGPESLDLTHSSIPEKLIFAQLNIANFMNFPGTVDRQSIYHNPIASFENYVNRVSAICSGLQDCANFHQFYTNYEGNNIIISKLLSIKKHLFDLRKINDARTTILNAVDNATNEDGELKRDDPYASKSLQNRLQEFANEKDQRNYIEPENAYLVIETYLPEKKKEVLLKHMPASWQAHYQSSDVEE